MSRIEYYDETRRQIDLLTRMIDLGYTQSFIEGEIKKVLEKRHGAKEDVSENCYKCALRHTCSLFSAMINEAFNDNTVSHKLWCMNYTCQDCPLEKGATCREGIVRGCIDNPDEEK